jgi:hypothetical protein
VGGLENDDVVSSLLPAIADWYKIVDRCMNEADHGAFAVTMNVIPGLVCIAYTMGYERGKLSQRTGAFLAKGPKESK